MVAASAKWYLVPSLALILWGSLRLSERGRLGNGVWAGEEAPCSTVTPCHYWTTFVTPSSEPTTHVDERKAVRAIGPEGEYLAIRALLRAERGCDSFVIQQTEDSIILLIVCSC